MTGSSSPASARYAHGAEHPARYHDHMDARGADGGDCRTRARPEAGILCDERPVEVDREGGDVRGKGFRELDYGGVPPVALTT